MVLLWYTKKSKTRHSFFFYSSQTTKSCKDLPAHGVRENGIFSLTASDGKAFSVFCDFISESGSVWTLISSFAYKNRDMIPFCKKGNFTPFVFLEGLEEWSPIPNRNQTFIKI